MVTPTHRRRLTCSCGRQFSVVTTAVQTLVKCPGCHRQHNLPETEQTPLTAAVSSSNLDARTVQPPARIDHSGQVPDVMALNLEQLSAISLEPPEDLRDYDLAPAAGELVRLDDPDLSSLPAALQAVFRELLLLRLLGRPSTLRVLQSTLSLDLIELQDRLQRLAARGLIHFSGNSADQMHVISPAQRKKRIPSIAAPGEAELPRPPLTAPELPQSSYPTLQISNETSISSTEQPVLRMPVALPQSANKTPEKLLPEQSQPSNQLQSVPPAPLAAPLRQQVLPSWIELLLKSPRFLYQHRTASRATPSPEEFARVLQTLDERGGRTTISVLSRQMELPMHRLRGRLALFQRVLNFDGSPVFRCDESTGIVEFDQRLLESQFELK